MAGPLPPPPCSPASPGWPRLVADIGGSNARFGWLPGPGGGVQHVRQVPVADHADLVGAVGHYLDGLRAALGAESAPAPCAAALAVATAVDGDEVRFTNSHWRFSRPDVRQRLGLDRLLLLNDFEALALSLPGLGDAQRRCHGGIAPRAEGTLAVVGPGTGLGVGGVVRTAAGWVALPGEGGHATLAAGDDLEAELIAWVRRRHAHVSAERLLSGIGLPVLHQALAAVRGCPLAAPWTPEQIVAAGAPLPGLQADAPGCPVAQPDAAASAADALAAETLEVFCALLGSFCGNVALTLGARSGLYLGGGILPRLQDRFFQSRFRERFEAKGRFQPYLAAVPTALITDTLAALAGAAFALEQPDGL